MPYILTIVDTKSDELGLKWLQESYATMLPGLVSAAATTKVYSCPTGREEYYDGAMQMVWIVSS